MYPVLENETDFKTWKAKWMKKININEIARVAGVSKTTVSRVINKSPLVKPSTVEKVNEVIERLDYYPSDLARGLRSNETRTIGVVVSNVMNPFFTSVVRGIEDVANKSNYNIFLCNTDENPEKEAQYLSMLASKRVDGLIIAGVGESSHYPHVIDNMKVVFIDRPPKGMENKFDVILVNNEEGSYRMVKHMLETGYRKIGLVGGSLNLSTGYERLMGYRRAYSEMGLAVDESIVLNGDFLGHSSYQDTITLLNKGICDAIYATNNMNLHGAMKALKEKKLSVPNDIGLASFDDMEWMELCGVSISAVRQPTYDMGVLAMNTLLKRIGGAEDDRETIVLDVTIFTRESTKKPE